MPVPLLAKGRQSCIDLRKFRDMDVKALDVWRADYAKGRDAKKLVFAMPTEVLVREKGLDTAATEKIGRSWIIKDKLYTLDELRSLIKSENRNAMDLLVAQLRSPAGVVPLVGAGLSVPFGFPGWPKFLREAAAFHDTPEKVLSAVKRNRLIEAASLLSEPSADRFQRLVEKWFGGPVAIDQTLKGPVSLLPLIAKGPSITTNFDHVLETAFQAAGCGFERLITGIEPDNVIRAMHRNEHVLIKMHGDASDRSARVFTGLEYKRQYRTAIPTLARIMFTNRPLLFLGCSLDRDRTLDVLADLHKQIPGLTHYAVLAAEYSTDKLLKRRHVLDGYGISPLWFMPGDFQGIEGILEELVHEASTRLFWRNPKPSAAWKPLRSPAKFDDAPHAKAPVSPRANETALLTRRLALRLAGGEIAFFLGAGIHDDHLPSARDFYSSLSTDYGFSEQDAQRAEVAQYLIDREGKSQAWAAARQKLISVRKQPSVVCQFLAELPALLRKLGRFTTGDQWLLTTNYDIVLEEAFAQRGEQFHLLSYQVDGHNEGRFAHRDLSGSIRIIERPENVRRMGGSASVIVKLDGGISWDRNIPETVAISPLDFSVSSGRLLTALPEAVRQVLKTRSLLVLGSSLRDAHVQRIVRWSAGSSWAVKTWAVIKRVTPTAAQFWPAAGVELIECDLSKFVRDLRRELQTLLTRAYGPPT